MGMFNNKPVTDEPIDVESLDADKNEEAAEKLSEESTDLAAELAEEEKEYEEAKTAALESMKDAAESSKAVADLINKITDEETTGYEPSADKLKEIKDFEDAFGEGASPLTVLVNLASRVKELEKKVF